MSENDLDKNIAGDSKLSPTVIKLGLVSFFADVASEMLYPITPIFLTSVLGASMASVGLIEGIAESIASLMKTYSGMWSDRIQKRKPFIMVGYLMGALAKPMIGLSYIWPHVLVARGFDRTGKGLRTAPRDALIADSVSEANRGAAFGWHRAMDTMGAVVGPLAALWFLSLNADHLRNLFFWALIPGLISVLIVLLVKENVAERSPKATQKNPFSFWKKAPKEFQKYIFAWALFSLVNSSDAFLIMQAKSNGVSMQNIILMYCTYNLVYAVSSQKLGALSDKMDRRWILAIGLFVFAAVYVGFGAATELYQFWFLFFAYGLYMGATDGVGKALAVDLCDRDLKGTALGILGTVTGLCTVFASTAAGLIWDHLGSRWTFIYGALGASLAALMIVKSGMRRREIKCSR